MTDITDNAAVEVAQLRLAAEQGDVQAMSGLAKRHWRGLGVKQDKDIAVAWWRRAASQGDSSSKFALALCRLNGDGLEKDEHRALQDIAALVGSGVTEASEWLADIQSKAVGCNLEAQYLWLMSIPGVVRWDLNVDEANMSQAEKAIAKQWLERAVAQKDGGAEFILSCFYEGGCNGWGVWKFANISEDNRKAIELESEAANAGNAQAQTYLGCRYCCGSSGYGIGEDCGKGEAWFRLGISKMGDHPEDIDDYDDYIFDYGLLGMPGFLQAFLKCWPMRGDIEIDAFIKEEDSTATIKDVVKDESPFWKCGNAAYWARYINEQGYINAFELTSAADGSSDFADLLRFYCGRWLTIAELDEFRRVFYWMNGLKKPFLQMLDGFDVWQLLSHIISKETDYYEYDHWGYDNFKTGQFVASLDQWMRRNKSLLAETYPLFTNGEWDELGTTLNDEFRRLRVVMNVVLRSLLVKVFGSYEKHIAMLAPLIENKFVYYEDYKAYVDALPTDKNDEFYQRLREKLGFVTEEGYRHSFEW